MRAELRAEFLKQRTTKTVLGLLGTMAGLVVLSVTLHTLGLPARDLASGSNQLRVLVEGGPSVARAFLDADLIDEAVIYQGPNPAGADGLMPFVNEGLDRLTGSGHFTQIHARSFGPDRMTWWRRMRTCSPALSAA